MRRGRPSEMIGLTLHRWQVNPGEGGMMPYEASFVSQIGSCETVLRLGRPWYKVG